MSLAGELKSGIAALGLEVPADASQRMLKYLELVGKWNKTYNLTAIREQDRMLTHHLLDSLAVLPHVKGPRVLDVGSGAGFPGIPLALARPDCHFTLLDSSHKKTAFMRQAVIELKLTNVELVCARVENWTDSKPFDAVISRAFSDLPEFLTLSGRLCAGNGVVIAMKGMYPHDELAQIPANFWLREVVSLRVPGLGAERHAALLQPAEAA